MSTTGQGTGSRTDTLFITPSGLKSFTPMPLTATWKAKVANPGLKNQWESIDIKCTFRQRRAKVTNARGDGVMSTAVIRCVEDVQPDDVIIYGGKAWPVITVDNVYDLNNTIVERIVSL